MRCRWARFRGRRRVCTSNWGRYCVHNSCELACWQYERRNENTPSIYLLPSSPLAVLASLARPELPSSRMISLLRLGSHRSEPRTYLEPRSLPFSHRLFVWLRPFDPKLVVLMTWLGGVVCSRASVMVTRSKDFLGRAMSKR
jgi:hypothetical protein